MQDLIYPEKFNSPFDVNPGYKSNTNYSPELDDSFIGIRISAPDIVKFTPGNIVDDLGSFVYIPISISYRFSIAYERKFDNITDHMVLVAVDSVTGTPYSETLQNDDSVEYLPIDFPEVSEQELNSTFGTGFMTVNLIHFLQIPQRSGDYNIHITLEKYQSNLLTVELIEGKD